MASERKQEKKEEGHLLARVSVALPHGHLGKGVWESMDLVAVYLEGHLVSVG